MCKGPSCLLLCFDVARMRSESYFRPPGSYSAPRRLAPTLETSMTFTLESHCFRGYLRFPTSFSTFSSVGASQPRTVSSRVWNQVSQLAISEDTPSDPQTEKQSPCLDVSQMKEERQVDCSRHNSSPPPISTPSPTEYETSSR